MGRRTHHKEQTSFVHDSYDHESPHRRLPFSISVGMPATNWPPNRLITTTRVEHSNQGCGTTQTSQWFQFRVFLLVPVPAQRSKRKQIGLQLAYDCRLSTRCFPGGRTLCTNWLHTGADLIQSIVSYVRIKTRTLKNSFAH